MMEELRAKLEFSTGGVVTGVLNVGHQVGGWHYIFTNDDEYRELTDPKCTDNHGFANDGFKDRDCAILHFEKYGTILANQPEKM